MYQLIVSGNTIAELADNLRRASYEVCPASPTPDVASAPAAATKGDPLAQKAAAPAAPAPAAPAPAAPAPAGAQSTPLSLANVKELVKASIDAGRRDGVVALLGEFGAANIAQLAPEKYAAFAAKHAQQVAAGVC